MEQKNEAIAKLLENTVLLQKKATELIVASSKLMKKVSELVEIFEEASRTKTVEDSELKPLLDKLSMLLEQNKTLAQGLILLERRIRR